jgi:hypothetical protein
MTLSLVFFLCGAGVLLTAIMYFGGIHESNRRA